jgi:hypothetical protein
VFLLQRIHGALVPLDAHGFIKKEGSLNTNNMAIARNIYSLINFKVVNCHMYVKICIGTGTAEFYFQVLILVSANLINWIVI